MKKFIILGCIVIIQSWGKPWPGVDNWNSGYDKTDSGGNWNNGSNKPNSGSNWNSGNDKPISGAQDRMSSSVFGLKP